MGTFYMHTFSPNNVKNIILEFTKIKYQFVLLSQSPICLSLTARAGLQTHIYCWKKFNNIYRKAKAEKRPLFAGY